MRQKINDFNILGVVVQVIITILVFVFGVFSLFKNTFFPVFEIIISLDLLIMAYNNQKIYKRKKATIIYLIVGILLFIIGLLSILGVI